MYNSLGFEGNVGGDAVTTTFDNSSVSKFNLGQTTRYTDKAGVEKEDTIWLPCELWNAKKETVELIKKGKRIIILESRLKSNNYETKEGVKVVSFVCNVVAFRVVESKSKDNS